MSRGFGPDQLLDLYRQGVFPMGDSRTDPRLFVVDPDVRGVLPLDAVHIPRRLKRTLRAEPFEVRCNTAFSAVVEACAAPARGRWSTWINSTIMRLYGELHARGRAHSIECWKGGRLVGGLYGVHLNAAFFGESMFSRETDASKVALMHLAARLKRQRFCLLDAQFLTDHLAQFGAIAIPRELFHEQLRAALSCDADFGGNGLRLSGQGVVQEITQTS